MPYYAGKFGSAAINGVVYTFSDWSISIETQSVEVTNFKETNVNVDPLVQTASGGNYGRGERVFIGNLNGGGEISCSGPLTAGIPPVGTYGAFSLSVNPTYPAFQTYGLITASSVTQDVEGKAEFTCTATVTALPIN